MLCIELNSRCKFFRQDAERPHVVGIDLQCPLAQSEAGFRFVTVYAIGEEDRLAAQRQIVGVRDLPSVFVKCVRPRPRPVPFRAPARDA